MIGPFAVILFFLLQLQFVPALLEKKMVVSHWGMEQGLPQSSVNDIIQTRDGYIWLATFGGLVRFDGHSFTTFDRSNTPGMHSDRILQLYEDSQGNIWLSTEEGFTRFRGEDSSTYYFTEGSSVQSPSSVIEDGYGNLWVIRYKNDELTFFGEESGLPSRHTCRFHPDNLSELTPLLQSFTHSKI